MGEFVELGLEGANHLVDKYFEKGWDTAINQRSPPDSQRPRTSKDQDTDARRSGRRKNSLPPPETDVDYVDTNARNASRAASSYAPNNNNNININTSSSTSHRYTASAAPPRNDSLERQSETSERVLRRYEDERDDPRRKPESVLSKKDLRRQRRDSRMSNANGYAQDYAPSASGRPRSQPPGGRYYDEADYDSDYDERSGRRFRSSGARGYDDYDDRGYDREIIETERYKGPARNLPRQDSYASRGYDEAAGAGAVTQYRRNDAAGAVYDNRRSRSRGRRDRSRSRSRSYSRSRSRSYSGSRERERGAGGIKGKLDDTFDTSMRGLGVGIAGAVIGGLAGREFGGKEHRNRDVLIGAVIGGLGANAAENKWHDWREEKKEKLHRDEEKLEARWDGRSRSAMR